MAFVAGLVGCVGSVDGGATSGGSGGPSAADADITSATSPGDESDLAGDAGGMADNELAGDSDPNGQGDTVFADGDGAYFGDSRCAAQAFILCDDFERANAASSLWTANTNNGGSIAIDTSRAARGSASVHMQIGADGGSQALLIETATFPLPDDAYFGRVFIYVNAPAPHASLLQSLGTLASATINVELGLTDNAGFFPLYQVSTGGEYGVWPDSYPQLPTGRWACLEWQYDSAASAMRYWLDETELAAIETGPTEDPPWTPPQYSQFSFGLAIAHVETAATQFDAWYDALALDAERIGCAR